MKMRILVILSLLMGFASTGSAAPKEDVARVVDSFYAQYYKEILRKSPTGDIGRSSDPMGQFEFVPQRRVQESFSEDDYGRPQEGSGTGA